VTGRVRIGGVRIGVVGLGVIGRHYVDAIAAVPGTELVAVCDRRPAALAGCRVPGFTDHRAMFGTAGLDAVVVTVPNDAHADVCRSALSAGLAVCVEKPLALTTADADALVRSAQRSGLPLLTAFHRRYNDNLAELLAGLPARLPVESVTVRYLERIEEHVGPDAWYLDPARCGGGCVADNGPNAFDLVRAVLGDDVRLTVRDSVIIRDGQGVDRQALIGLDSDTGVRATVELDWSYHGEVKDVLVRFADGSTSRADLLAGFPGFKSSLRHEYVGVLRAFLSASPPTPELDGGLVALALVDDTYRMAHPDVMAAAWR
jgi:predicted dehydrogenase